MTTITLPPGTGDSGGAGASSFSDLSDTPANYAGFAGCTLVVKADETGLEYQEQPPGALVADHVVAKVGGTASTLTDALAAASSWEVIYVTAGRFNENVTISSPLIVIGTGPGTQIWGADSAATITLASGSVILQDLRVRNDGTCPLVEIQGDDCLLDRVTLHGGGIGVKINGAVRTQIEDSWFRNQSGRGIWADGGSASTRILRNTIKNAGAEAIAGDALELGESLFEDNLIENSGGYGIGLWGAGQVIIRGNTFSNTGNDSIRLYQCSSPVICDNVIADPTGRGIELDSSDDAVIESNIVRRSAAEGIWSRGNRVMIMGNDCRSCSGNGIGLYGILPVQDYKITGNYSMDNTGYGIDLGNTSSSNLLVHANYLARNLSGSINNDTGTNNVIISDNLVI